MDNDSSKIKKILIIDDEELLTKTYTKVLEKKGYDTYTATNGVDALVMAEEEDFDLIISDIKMPGINGLEIITKIKSKNAYKQIPFIFVTGYADEYSEKGIRSLQPLSVIYKPFDIQELLEKVNQALGK